MTVRLKLLILTLLPLVLAAGALSVVSMKTRQISDTVNIATQYHVLSTEITDLNFISYRYLYHFDAVTRKRWEEKHGKVESVIKALRGGERREQNLHLGLKLGVEKLQRDFRRLEDVRNARRSSPLADELETLRADAIMNELWEMASMSRNLEEMKRRRMVEIRRSSIYVSNASLILLALLVSGFAFFLQRRTSRGLAALSEATRVLRRGNLSFRARLPGKDELALLAKSMNEMARDLLLSRSELEQKSEALESKKRELEALNAELETKVTDRTLELARTNTMLASANAHAEKLAAAARLQAGHERDLARRTGLLIRSIGDIMCRADPEIVLRQVMELARELTESRYALAGHYRSEGLFFPGCSATAPGSSPCPEGTPPMGGEGGSRLYATVAQGGEVVRLTREDLRRHPPQGLPETHIPLLGLLAVPIPGEGGASAGMLMVTDKLDGTDFTLEDEMVLTEVAVVAGAVLGRVPEAARLLSN